MYLYYLIFKDIRFGCIVNIIKIKHINNIDDAIDNVNINEGSK